MPVCPISVTFFFTVHLYLRICPIKSVECAWPQKTEQKSKLFSSMLFTNKESMIVLCLKQHCNSWAAKTFFRLFSLYFRRKMRLLSGGKLIFGQQNLLEENVVKGPAQYKFGPAYWYNLSLFSKIRDIWLKWIKVYKEVVGDFIRFLQIYLCLLCVHLFFFVVLWIEPVVFSFCPKNLFSTNCLKILTVLDKNFTHWHINELGTTRRVARIWKKGGLFWKSEKSANYLDPNFHSF